jgi:hypothetical protein
MENFVHDRKLDIHETLIRRIVTVVTCINDRGSSHLLTCSVVRRVRTCIEAEHLLQR